MIMFIIYPLILFFGITCFILLQEFSFIPTMFLPSFTFFLVLPVVLLLERIYPFNKDWNNKGRELKTDIFLTLGLLPILTFFLEKLLLYANQYLNIYSLADNFSFWEQFFIAFLLSEFIFYWYHRYSHNLIILRKFHSFHHNVDKVYWANSGRFHFVDMILQFSFYFIPIYLLRVSIDVAALLLSLSAITGVLEHSNINYKTKYINYFFNTVDLHHLHHSKNSKESNSNFGKVTIIFDVIFRTYLNRKIR